MDELCGSGRLSVDLARQYSYIVALFCFVILSALLREGPMQLGGATEVDEKHCCAAETWHHAVELAACGGFGAAGGD
jgi:hypothetical protein